MNEFETAAQICRRKGCSAATFYRLKKEGIIPPGEPVGLRKRRWRVADIDAAFESLKTAPRRAA